MCAEKSIRTHYKYKRQCSPLIIFPLSISTLCVELVHVCLFVCLFASSGRERVSISHTDTRRPSKYTRRRLSARPPATSHRDPSISLSRWAGRSTWKINYFPFILVPFVRQNWPEINKILGKVLPWSFMVERTVERWAVTHLYYQSHAGCRCGWQPMELWATLGCGYLSETNDSTVSRIGLSGIVFVSSPLPTIHVALDGARRSFTCSSRRKCQTENRCRFGAARICDLKHCDICGIRWRTLLFICSGESLRYLYVLQCFKYTHTREMELWNKCNRNTFIAAIHLTWFSSGVPGIKGIFSMPFLSNL